MAKGKKQDDWKAYLKTLTQKQRNVILEQVVERLIECEELSFREKETDPDPEYCHEACLYWPGSGDNLLETDE